MSTPTFDEATCITAQELREMGIAVPESIPDEGWVPRASVHFSVGQASLEDKTMKVPVALRFTEPFRWVEVDALVEPGAK